MYSRTQRRTFSDEAKEIVVINTRYIRAVSGVEGHPGDPESNALILERMKAAIELSSDPFYRDQLPDYDWERHEFRTLEYVSSLTDFNNEKGYSGEDLQFINKCTKRMKELYDSEDLTYKEAHTIETMDINVYRNAYLAGEIDLEEYRRELVELSNRDSRRDLSEDISIIILLAPLEYMLLIDHEDPTEEEISFLKDLYSKLITYGRDLVDEEMGLIMIHPAFGAYLLSRSRDTERFADIARGHHKWYDDSAGYPEDFELAASPYRTIVSIVACADCLDAATDAVGRNYKVGRDLDELIEELEAAKGTRYSPDVVELLSNEEVLAEVNEILRNQRDRNYIKTYNDLEEYDIWDRDGTISGIGTEIADIGPA